jgi:hypothetical protein
LRNHARSKSQLVGLQRGLLGRLRTALLAPVHVHVIIVVVIGRHGRCGRQIVVVVVHQVRAHGRSHGALVLVVGHARDSVHSNVWRHGSRWPHST